MGIFWVHLGLRVEVGWLDCRGVKAINNSNKEEEENMVACGGEVGWLDWRRVKAIRPNLSERGDRLFWSRVVSRSFPPRSHLLLRLWVISWSWSSWSLHLTLFCIFGLYGQQISMQSLMWHDFENYLTEEQLDRMEKCVKLKKVWGEISWIGHLVGFLPAHFTSDVYIIQTPWNILLPIREVYMLPR